MKGKFVELVENVNNELQSNITSTDSKEQVTDNTAPIVEGLSSIKEVIYKAFDNLNGLINKSTDGKGPRDFYTVFGANIGKTGKYVNLFSAPSDIFLKVKDGCLFMINKEGKFIETSTGLLKNTLLGGNTSNADLKATYDKNSIMGVIDDILNEFDKAKVQQLSTNLVNKFNKAKVKVDNKIIENMVNQMVKEIIRVIFADMKITVINKEEMIGIVKGLTLAISMGKTSEIDAIKAKLNAS